MKAQNSQPQAGFFSENLSLLGFGDKVVEKSESSANTPPICLFTNVRPETAF
jgi:hypothetical protein